MNGNSLAQTFQEFVCSNCPLSSSWLRFRSIHRFFFSALYRDCAALVEKLPFNSCSIGKSMAANKTFNWGVAFNPSLMLSDGTFFHCQFYCDLKGFPCYQIMQFRAIQSFLFSLFFSSIYVEQLWIFSSLQSFTFSCGSTQIEVCVLTRISVLGGIVSKHSLLRFLQHMCSTFNNKSFSGTEKGWTCG